MKTEENGIDVNEAVDLLNQENSKLTALILRADAARYENSGNRVVTCAILNAKSGNCSENCSFCPQSIYSDSDIEKYGLLNSSEVVDKATEAASSQAHSFGIVTSGRKIYADSEKKEILDSITKIKSEAGISPCCSLGVIDQDFMLELKKRGLKALHHNLETARSFYGNICTTRTYDDNVNTLIRAKKIGLSVCSGGIFGLGESLEQRVELLNALRVLDVDSVAVNFFNPVPGTPLGESNIQPLTPFDCLRIIAVARLMMPAKQIRICGGRERNLRDFQSWIFAAGADSLMIGSYLTTNGRRIEDDLQMIKDAGMILAEDGCCGY